MIQFIYNLILNLIQFVVFNIPLPLKSKKLNKWRNGQKTVWTEIDFTSKKTIWFHISSSGEFEQAKPLIDFLRRNKFKIVATFFSPSGYEELKNSPLLDKVYYLPIDTKKNAQKFIERVSPIAAVFVKYDFWLNYMTELNKAKIPSFVISGVFSTSHFMFSLFGKAHLKQLRQFQYISVQDKESYLNLKRHNINSQITGDTRIDRSLELPKEPFEDLKIQEFCKSARFSLIIGSSWKNDISQFEKIYPKLKELGIKLIIAPHELHKDKIAEIQQKLNAALYTDKDLQHEQYNTLIINTIGILKYIYRYADIVYIGGGFDDGIHNTLEPATYSKPILFGPNYQKFMEANIMIENGGAFSIQSSSELYEKIKDLVQNKNHIKVGQCVNQYLLQYKGATEKIGQTMLKVLNKDAQ